MSIMDMFRNITAPVSGAPVNPAANGPATPGNIPASQVVPAAVPGQGVVPTPEAKEQSPLDQFTDLFKIDPNATAQSSLVPAFNVDQVKLREAAARNDFLKVMTPEMSAKIQAGGPEALQTVMSVMNAVAQKGFGDSALATTQIVEQALARHAAAMEARMPSIIKSQTVSENLSNANPVFKHPAAQPLLDLLKQSISQKNSNASTSEQTQLAQDYLTSLIEAATPKKAAEAVPKGENWEAYFNPQ